MSESQRRRWLEMVLLGAGIAAPLLSASVVINIYRAEYVTLASTCKRNPECVLPDSGFPTFHDSPKIWERFFRAKQRVSTATTAGVGSQVAAVAAVFFLWWRVVRTPLRWRAWVLTLALLLGLLAMLYPVVAIDIIAIESD